MKKWKGYDMGEVSGKNIVAEKSLDFAVRIVRMCRHLAIKRHEQAMTSQVLRSGTSIGANIHEAASAQSKADFVSKLSIALKECDETGYWLELLFRVSCLSQSEYDSIEADRRELFALLTSIIKTAKGKLA